MTELSPTASVPAATCCLEGLGAPVLQRRIQPAICGERACAVDEPLSFLLTTPVYPCRNTHCRYAKMAVSPTAKGAAMQRKALRA